MPGLVPATVITDTILAFGTGVLIISSTNLDPYVFHVFSRLSGFSTCEYTIVSKTSR